MYVEIFDTAEEFKEFVESNQPWIKIFSIFEVQGLITLSFSDNVKGMDRPKRRNNKS